MVLLLFFSNQPFIVIDSDTYFCFYLFIVELFKEAWECGYNNIEGNGKDCQRIFDTDSSALRPHSHLPITECP